MHHADTEASSRWRDEVAELVDHHHEAAHRALQEQQCLDAVAWVSAHVAAVDRVLYPAARRSLRNGRRMVRAQRAADRRLLDAAWRLDRRVTGDVLNSASAVDTLIDEVRTRLAAHVTGEHRLLLSIAALGEEARRRLVDDLSDATMHAPTRPHPLAPHVRGLSAIAFRVEALVDRVRDALDTRHVPVPRRRRPPREAGLWGMYALGGTSAYPTEQERTAPRAQI